jgi:O-antigen biosynthesis protein
MDARSAETSKRMSTPRLGDREPVRDAGTDQRIRDLVSALEATERELAQVSAELALLKSSPQLELSLLWQLRLRLFPAGTWRERFAKKALRLIVTAGRRTARLSQPAGRQEIGAGRGAEPAPPIPYDQWVRSREPDPSQLRLQRTISERFSTRPLVSIICPVFGPSASVLAEAIASVRAQSYDHWELILVEAGSQPAEVAGVLVSCGQEPQITVVRLDENLGIAGNTNRGLAAAKGEFVAFLDHDDLLAPDALYEAVRLLNDDPEADVIYFDEDKVSADGTVRCEPYFKPDWCPEHLLSTNYLMHSVVRRATVEAAGGLSSQFDGAQDWDLALRIAEHGAKPRHVPSVLYHWRKVPGSSAAVAEAKPWALEAQTPCVTAHLKRRGFTDIVVEAPTIGVLRPRWKGRDSRVSIIIPTRDRSGILKKCLSSMLEVTEYPDYEVLVVDTGSAKPETERLYEELANHPQIRLLRREGEFNYSGVNNWAAAQATGKILLFLNNDIEVLDPGWLEELARWAELEEIGCVGAKLLYPDGTIQHAGLVIGLQGHASQIFRFEAGQHHWSSFGSPESYRNSLALTGACLAVRREVFEQIGGFDEEYRLCYNDIDLCLRIAAAGYRNLYTPFARLIHHEGASRGFTVPPAEVLRASIEMLPLIMNGDPSFSPALSYSSVSPRLAGQNEPEERANRIALITRNFGVFDAWAQAINEEVLGETRRWARYRPLLERFSGPASGQRTGSNQLRILIATHDLSRTGAPMLAAHLAHYLHNQGLSITVVSPKPGPMREEFESRGARVLVCPGVLMTPYAFEALFSSHDVVLANTILSWRVVLAARAAQKPCLWFIHESDFGYEYARAHRGIGSAFNSATRVVFPSAETEGRYREFTIGRKTVIHYGIEPVSAEGAAFEKTPGKLYVVLAGSIEPRKGQDVLVAALERVPARVRGNIETILIGGTLDKEFERRVRTAAARIGGIRFLPQTSFSEMLDLVATSDVLVCASRDDPSPLLVFEAMALGLAVLSTRVGAVPELISDGESGLLVEKEDARAIAAALVRLHDDRDFVRRLGMRARQRFEEHLTLDRYGADVFAELSSECPDRRAER